MRTPIPLILLATLLLTGCASGLGPETYERHQARSVHEVVFGTVLEVRKVLIEGTKTGVGPAAGASIGMITTSGSGRSGGVMGILGAVGGGIAGAAVEEAATRQKGYEITVKLDSGRTLAITQAATEEFKPGERVRVLFGGRGSARVTH